MDLEYFESTTQIIPDREFYRTGITSATLRPWLIPGEMLSIYMLIQHKTLVRPECCYTLHKLATQCLRHSGEFWECGVFQGGTAEFLPLLIAHRGNRDRTKLRLFDTFEGMPATDANLDRVSQGDFANVSFDQIQRDFARYSDVSLHRGFIPD